MHYPPKFGETQFHCIHCNVFAAQGWANLYKRGPGGFEPNGEFKTCRCLHCEKTSYWYQEKMIVPCSAPVPPPHSEMPADCIVDYNEARSIVGSSPRAGSALVRLALQKLMIALGEKGKNINDDIKALVSKGLPVEVQRSLDICRIVGNNAVHPGEIDLNDTPDIAYALFGMINFIVEDRIARPKQIEAYYKQIPQSLRDAIEVRDRPKE